MRGNLSTLVTCTCSPAARARARVASNSATAHGPIDVHTTLVEQAELAVEVQPVRLDQPVRQQVQAQPHVVRVGRCRLQVGDLGEHDDLARPARTGSSPVEGGQLGRLGLASVAAPSAGCGYQTSSTVPSGVRVARPCAYAVSQKSCGPTYRGAD